MKPSEKAIEAVAKMWGQVVPGISLSDIINGLLEAAYAIDVAQLEAEIERLQKWIEKGDANCVKLESRVKELEEQIEGTKEARDNLFRGVQEKQTQLTRAVELLNMVTADEYSNIPVEVDEGIKDFLATLKGGTKGTKEPK